MKLLLYSHDSYGLGHLRRSVTIASRILEIFPSAAILIASGSPVATQFRLPHGVEILKLPSVTKGPSGAYIARGWTMDVDDLVQLRAGLLEAAIRSFQPHALLVDHTPAGLLGELGRAFAVARAIGTRCILGVRDIIDDPVVVAREWRAPAVRDALNEVYDSILVYGDRTVFDTAKEYEALRAHADRISYTGYVVRKRTRPPIRPLALVNPHVVLTLGGGQDGSERVHAYLRGLERERPDWCTTIVLGPLFEAGASKDVRRRAEALERVRVHRCYDDLPSLLRDASAVVAMAGYNTCAEILQARVPAVVLPRSRPRTEQLIRAQRLAAMGLVTCYEDDSSDGMLERIDAATREGRQRRPLPALDGALRAASHVVRSALESSVRSRRSSSAAQQDSGVAS